MNQRVREILEYLRDAEGNLDFEHLADFLEGLEISVVNLENRYRQLLKDLD